MELSFTFFNTIFSEAVSCWQCGVFHRGIRDECWKADQQKHNCAACLKTYTRVYLHDSWRKFRCKSVTIGISMGENIVYKDR